MAHCGQAHSCSAAESSSVRQTLEEMDFERGIWSAAQQNDLDRIDSLLKKGAPVNGEDVAGYTALHYAARNGHHLVCEKLLKNGARVDAKTRSGQATALHRAASQGHLNIVELLLTARANPNIQDSDGCLALHRAIKAHAVRVCKVLIPLTDLELVDSGGRTPLDLAKDKEIEEIVDLLQKSR